MLKERIQEVFEFAKSESPYQKANKGWINQDIFLDLGPTSDTLKQKNETAKVTFLWSPINTFLSNIFLTCILCCLLVFTSISIVKGRFQFDLIHISSINDLVKVDQNKALKLSQQNYRGFNHVKVQDKVDEDDLAKPEITNSQNDILIQSDQKIETDKIDIKSDKTKLNEFSKDTKNLKNKKSKSNFI